MTVRAGTWKVDFGNGKVLPIPVDKVSRVLKAFPGARVYAENSRTAFGRNPMPGLARDLTRGAAQKGLDALPTIGGIGGQIAGGVLGAPALLSGPWGVMVPATMSVAGAGIGGAVGQGARELGYRGMGMGDAPGTIGGASEEQAKGSALGEGAARLIGLLARPLVAHGMGNPPHVPGEPNPVTTNINEVRAPTGKTIGKMGSAKATVAREASSQNLENHMADLAKSGHKVNGTAAIDRAYQKLSGELAHDATGVGQTQLDNFYNETIARHGKNLDPRLALKLRQRWDRASKPIIEAIKRMKKGGPLPDPSIQLKAQWEKAIADEMRSEIETTSGAAAGITAEQSAARGINRVTQRRIGVERAIKGVEGAKRRINPIVTGVGGVAAGLAGGVGSHSLTGGGAGALGGAIAAHLATQPEVTSRLGLGLTDPYIQMLLRMTPRFAIPQGQK
jgi:hypothetical protein